MRSALRIRCLLLALSLETAILPGMAFPQSQSVSDYQVKAAYLYNFAKFVEWPSESFASPTTAFRFCVLDDLSFESALNQIVKGKTIAGRPVEVARAHSAEQRRSCHILFVNSSQRNE